METNIQSIKTTSKIVHQTKAAAKVIIAIIISNRLPNFINQWLQDNHQELAIRDKAQTEDEKK